VGASGRKASRSRKHGSEGKGESVTHFGSVCVTANSWEMTNKFLKKDNNTKKTRRREKRKEGGLDRGGGKEKTSKVGEQRNYRPTQ